MLIQMRAWREFTFHRATLVAAFVASLSALLTALIGLAPWVMFVGWVAFFTRPPTWQNALSAGLCSGLGFVLAIGAAHLIGALMPVIGVLSFACAVFVCAFAVVSLRVIPWVNNLAAWFIGMIAFFAAHPPLHADSLAVYLAIIWLGVFSGWLTVFIQQWLTRPA